MKKHSIRQTCIREITSITYHSFQYPRSQLHSATVYTMTTYNPVGPAALSLPIFKKLANRRVVLASASPRRKEIFANAVRSDPITSLQTMGAVHILMQAYQTQKGLLS